jgi:hypothetical protein
MLHGSIFTSSLKEFDIRHFCGRIDIDIYHTRGASPNAILPFRAGIR